MAEVQEWITVNGRHVPIMDGQTKEEAVKSWTDDRERQIAKNKEQADKLNLKEYAREHHDIFITDKLTNSFSPEEVKGMVDKISEVYDEFGISDKMVYTLDADQKNLESVLATGAAHPSGILSVNPKSNVLREENFQNIYHEMGHFLDYQVLRKSMPHSNPSTTPNFANRVAYEATRNLAKKYPNEKPYISNYGMTNNKELMAEAVRDYMVNRDKSKPYSQEIVRVIKKYVRSNGIGNPR